MTLEIFASYIPTLSVQLGLMSSTHPPKRICLLKWGPEVGRSIEYGWDD